MSQARLVPGRGPAVEQKMVVVKDDGHSFLLAGDLETKRGCQSTTDILAPLLNIGWRVAEMTPFSGSGSILVLLQRETPL